MKNKKAQDGLYTLIIILGIMLLMFVIFIVAKNDADKFRKTSEGKCFQEIAMNFCWERNMSFSKLYSSWFDDYEFACNERGNLRKYDFYLKIYGLRHRRGRHRIGHMGKTSGVVNLKTGVNFTVR